MTYLIIIFICLFSSIIGAICGIGGGVIIKPVFDAFGIMPVKIVSFLSGCTVLSMSIVSFYKNMRYNGTRSFQKEFAVTLALGSVIGGILGKSWFQKLLLFFPDQNNVGAVQSVILMIITLVTLIYTMKKESIPTYHVRSRFVILLIGMLLGIMSSFLGIGGGPINLVVLFFLFSMSTKEAALYSIFIIFFSQLSSLLSMILTKTVPEFQTVHLLLMIGCGVAGGYTGSWFNKKLNDDQVSRLFMFVLVLIIFTCIYNIQKYL